jgi:Leu/Phe-tRNA-protein transferase
MIQFSKDDDLAAILPLIANQYEEEFCIVPDGFDADFIETLVWHGWFPMAAAFGPGRVIMLAKIHKQRCVLELASLHVPKKVRQRSSKLRMTVDAAWTATLEGINKYHGEESWLYPSLVAALKQLFDERATRKVKMHTVEVWSEDRLVAADLGYQVGGVYTSMSGFYDPDFPSAGSIQCCALGRLLLQQGFFLWDLGMKVRK